MARKLLFVRSTVSSEVNCLLFNINLGCLHPVACVRSGDGGILYPSTQRHYHRLILLLILLYCYMFWLYDHHQTVE
jgi:hypothetical protein